MQTVIKRIINKYARLALEHKVPSEATPAVITVQCGRKKLNMNLRLDRSTCELVKGILSH